MPARQQPCPSRSEASSSLVGDSNASVSENPCGPLDDGFADDAEYHDASERFADQEPTNDEHAAPGCATPDHTATILPNLAGVVPTSLARVLPVLHTFVLRSCQTLATILRESCSDLAAGRWQDSGKTNRFS